MAALHTLNPLSIGKLKAAGEHFMSLKQSTAHGSITYHACSLYERSCPGSGSSAPSRDAKSEV